MDRTKDTPPIDEAALQDTVIEPVSSQKNNSKPAFKGRLADKLAAIIAVTALGVSILLSGLFFAGFVVNDYHIFAITSALGLSLFLGAFAIGPLLIITILARKAYRDGGQIKLYLWVLFLILPWLTLSILGLTHTALPIWMSLAAVLFAASLTLWGVVSCLLEIRNKRL